MGNSFLAISNFYCLSSRHQREILEACMRHELITWVTVSTQVYPAFKDQEFLANLMTSHKNGTAAPTTPASQPQETYKRPKIEVTPEELKPAAVPNFAATNAQRQLLAAFMQIPAMIPVPIETKTQKVAAINNTDGNKYKSADWAQLNLATTRKNNWIYTKGTGISSYFSNPKKAVHMLFNWYKKAVSDSNLNNIKFIDSLKQSIQLAKSVKRAFHTPGITLTRSYKEFADVFACTEPEINPILIVAVAKVHETYKKGVVGVPRDEHFTVLLLLFQTEPHVCLPFETAKMNLHLGNMIRNKDYKKSVTFDKYMKKNMNHKLVPIQNEPPDKHTIEQVLQLKAYYTTKGLATSTA